MTQGFTCFPYYTTIFWGVENGITVCGQIIQETHHSFRKIRDGVMTKVF